MLPTITISGYGHGTKGLCELIKRVIPLEQVTIIVISDFLSSDGAITFFSDEGRVAHIDGGTLIGYDGTGPATAAAVLALLGLPTWQIDRINRKVWHQRNYKIVIRRRSRPKRLQKLFGKQLPRTNSDWTWQRFNKH